MDTRDQKFEPSAEATDIRLRDSGKCSFPLVFLNWIYAISGRQGCGRQPRITGSYDKCVNSVPSERVPFLERYR
ncbi:hypothetical protein GN956_G20820 [Arapaima gigas]